MFCVAFKSNLLLPPEKLGEGNSSEGLCLAELRCDGPLYSGVEVEGGGGRPEEVHLAHCVEVRAAQKGSAGGSQTRSDPVPGNKTQFINTIARIDIYCCSTMSQQTCNTEVT